MGWDAGNQSDERAIIHVDMDAFYASVEQREEPAYRGRPVIVGGLGGRGVVAAASYEARQFGVHSAMPMARARRLCPDGVYLAPRFQLYREVSAAVFDIFGRYTPLVEGISLDEAWLDVTHSRRLFGDIRVIGRRLKSDIREGTGLVASIGMAPNKFLAKLASDVGKPDGFFRVTTREAVSFLAPLPVNRLWGIGPKAAAKLRSAGIETIGQLAGTPEDSLRRWLGNSAAHFARLARGIDEREVTPARPEKSVSHEQTFERDLREAARMEKHVLSLGEAVGARLRERALVGSTITVKIRTAQWRTYTRSRTLSVPTSSTSVIFRTAVMLLSRWRLEHPDDGVRLLGVGVTRLADARQETVFGDSEGGTDRVLDSIRERFGSDALLRGRLVERDNGNR